MQITRAAVVAVAVVSVLTACSAPKETPAPVEQQKYDPRVLHREFSVREADMVRGGSAIRSAEDRDVLFWRHHEGPTVVRDDALKTDGMNARTGEKGGANANRKDASAYASKKDASAYAKKDASVYSSPRKDASAYSKPQKRSQSKKQ